MSRLGTQPRQQESRRWGRRLPNTVFRLLVEGIIVMNTVTDNTPLLGVPILGGSDNGNLSAPGSAPAPDPFDPARLRLSQDYLAAAGVKKLLTTVPVRKPSKEWFVRCHPDPAYRIETCVI